MLQLLICSKWGLMQFTQQIWSFLFCLFSYNTNWTLRLYLRIHLVKRFSQQRSSQRKFSQLVVSVIVTLTCCSKSPDSSVPNGAMISLLISWRGNISLDWWITQTHHNSNRRHLLVFGWTVLTSWMAVMTTCCTDSSKVMMIWMYSGERVREINQQHTPIV